MYFSADTYRYAAEPLILGGDGQHVVEIHGPSLSTAHFFS